TVKLAEPAGTITVSYQLPDLNNLQSQLYQYAGTVLSTTFAGAIAGYMSQPVEGMGATAGAILGASGAAPASGIQSGVHVTFNSDAAQQLINGQHSVKLVDISYVAGGSWSPPPAVIPLTSPLTLGPLVLQANAVLSAWASYSFVLDGQL